MTNCLQFIRNGREYGRQIPSNTNLHFFKNKMDVAFEISELQFIDIIYAFKVFMVIVDVVYE